MSTGVPLAILPGIYAFRPNRDTLGATAYLIVENTGNILVDCPLWEEINQRFLIDQGGISQLYLTHRGGISKHIGQIQNQFDCQIVIQEQEAYLLPELSTVSFESEIELNESCLGFWTPGHSPGSSCLYYKKQGGVLFTGRHILADSVGQPRPLRSEKTFHWPRQLKNAKLLCHRFRSETLSVICPAANTGYLRGRGYIPDAYDSLKAQIISAEN